MITEVAHLTVDLEKCDDFEAAVAAAVPAFRAAQGCRGMALERVIESPGQYRLRVSWESVHDHMVTFRNSAAFQTWRSLAGPHFTSPPTVEHTEAVRSYF